MKGKQIVKSYDELVSLFKVLRQNEWQEPLEINWDIADESRGLSQDALAHVWYRDAAKQLGDLTALEVKAMCKLDFAVPLLVDNERYMKAFYDGVYNYTREGQLVIMEFFPATSLLKKKQMSEYMSDIQTYFAKNGVHLQAQGEYEDIMNERYS